jgi:hypothetical protein
MAPVDIDLRYRRLLSEMSDAELAQYIDSLREEQARLAELHHRDSRLLAEPHAGALGKLRPRLVLTKAKWKAFGTRRLAAQSELAVRRTRRTVDWDAPTETDPERLRGKLRSPWW